MKFYTTLRMIKKYNPCSFGLQRLVALLGAGYPEDKKIYAFDVLERGMELQNVLWGFRAVPKTQQKEAFRTMVFFACDCTERVLSSFESVYPTDERPRKAIEVARKCVEGKSTANAAYAATHAAHAAAHAAHAATQDAAHAATQDAAHAAHAATHAAHAAGHAAYAACIVADAAVDVAHAAAHAASAADAAYEREWQQKRLAQYLKGEV